MCPATLYTMCRTRQPRPIRPISNTPRWARRRRCSVALRTTTRKAHSDWASIDALAVFELPACPSGTPGPTCTLFQAVCSSTWEVLYVYKNSYLAHGRWAQRAINRLPAPHTATLPSCLWSRSVFLSHAFCYWSQNNIPGFVKKWPLSRLRTSDEEIPVRV